MHTHTTHRHTSTHTHSDANAIKTQSSIRPECFHCLTREGEETCSSEGNKELNDRQREGRSQNERLGEFDRETWRTKVRERLEDKILEEEQESRFETRWRERGGGGASPSAVP